MLEQVPVRKASRQEAKEDQRQQQGQHPGVPKAQGRGPLLGHLPGALQSAESVFAEGRVRADPLDVQKTSVG